MDNCPNCKVSWIGDPIPERMREHYSPPYFWRREIGIEIQGKGDRIDHYLCPDCGHEVSRKDHDNPKGKPPEMKG